MTTFSKIINNFVCNIFKKKERRNNFQMNDTVEACKKSMNALASNAEIYSEYTIVTATEIANLFINTFSLKKDSYKKITSKNEIEFRAECCLYLFTCFVKFTILPKIISHIENSTSFKGEKLKKQDIDIVLGKFVGKMVFESYSIFSNILQERKKIDEYGNKLSSFYFLNFNEKNETLLEHATEKPLPPLGVQIAESLDLYDPFCISLLMVYVPLLLGGMRILTKYSLSKNVDELLLMTSRQHPIKLILIIQSGGYDHFALDNLTKDI